MLQNLPYRSFFIFQYNDLCFEIRIISCYRSYLKSLLALYDDGSTAIGHFYQFYNLGNCSNIFQI